MQRLEERAKPAVKPKPLLAGSTTSKTVKDNGGIQRRLNKTFRPKTSRRLESNRDKQNEVQILMTQCPHCSRRFNKAAAERHIAICAKSRAKPKDLLTKLQLEE